MLMREINLQIQKPNDAGQYSRTLIKSETKRFSNNHCYFIRNKKDPVHAGLVNWWKKELAVRKHSGYYRNYGESQEYEHTIYIQKLPVIVSKEGIRYYINGKAESLNTICNALARVTYKSCFDKEAPVLMKTLMSSLSLSENIKYCLENRAPYHFFDNFEKIECRLNIQQISAKECAVEVSDGTWGVIKNKELESYCSFYVQGHKKSRWKYISPANLFERTVGRKPSDSELTLMVEFLKQNRTSDLVEKRAIQLVNDLLLQHGSRLKAVYEQGELQKIYVHGKEYDWMLTNDKFKSQIQMVKTYVKQPHYRDNEFGEMMVKYREALAEYEADLAIKGESELTAPKMPKNSWNWRGPICIDNMTSDSPLGDQFAARALALLNDTFTIKIVSTIRRYLIKKPNDNERVDFNEM
tara:strand:- start:435 stop:1667 length:1233 start_codon:yes stop_codon:yes gene_type:complete